MRQRLALCVGINDYPGSGSDLSGCVNDAQDWAHILQDRGYEVVSLFDADATKANMVQALQGALSRLKRRDRFVFTFSGHGTWVPDQDGDEIDQRDEALCCQDYNRGGLLSDDEMHAIFQARKYGSRVTVISDSCHSGTVARLMGLSADAIRPKFISPSTFSNISEKEAARTEATTSPAKPRSSAVLLSGCSDLEYSYDASFEGRPNGAFTYTAIKALKHALTVEEVYTAVRQTLPSPAYPQTPQLAAGPFQKFTPLL